MKNVNLRRNTNNIFTRQMVWIVFNEYKWKKTLAKKRKMNLFAIWIFRQQCKLQFSTLNGAVHFSIYEKVAIDAEILIKIKR